jgi:hypothetical protein
MAGGAGRRLLVAGAAVVLAAGMAALPGAAIGTVGAVGRTVRFSVSSTGAQANGGSYFDLKKSLRNPLWRSGFGRRATGLAPWNDEIMVSATGGHERWERRCCGRGPNR